MQRSPARRTLVDRLELSGGELQYRDDFDFNDGRLTIVMTAPDVRHFAISGDNNISIAGYNQDDLSVDVSGHGTVNAKGKTRAEAVDISGDGDIDMSGLAAKSARADISGSGRASIAPTDEANVDISGSGEIDLLTHPAKLSSDVSGSGRIVEGAAAPAPSSSAPPAAPPPPPPPKVRWTPAARTCHQRQAGLGHGGNLFLVRRQGHLVGDRELVRLLHEAGAIGLHLRRRQSVRPSRAHARVMRALVERSVELGVAADPPQAVRPTGRQHSRRALRQAVSPNPRVQSHAAPRD